MKPTACKWSCLLLLLIIYTAKAQHHELGAGVGIMNYRGELAPHLNYWSPRAGAGLLWRQNWNTFISSRVALLYGRIEADDRQKNDGFARQRNHHFQTDLTELSFIFEYNFLNYRSQKEGYFWSPYLLMGLAGFRMNPQLNRQPDYSLYSLALPIGAGVKIALGRHWNLNLEFGARKTFTDYLDDLYTNDRLASLRPPKYYTGNPNNKDWYFFTGIYITYTFYKPPCPDFYRF